MRPATGAERAALVLLALGEAHGGPIWNELSDDEIAVLTRAMARLGSIDQTYVTAALDLFQGELVTLSGLAGTPEAAGQIVAKVLPEPRALPHLERLRKPQGPDVWQQLGGLSDQVLADYLAGEHPQTAALILSRLAPPHAARVLARLEPEFSLDCLDRMMGTQEVDQAVLGAVEATLGTYLVAPNTGPAQPDPAVRVADIFNALDKRAGEDLLGRWQQAEPETADKVRGMMFTFDDFIKLPASVVQVLLRGLDKDTLGLALKGAPPEVRSFFLDQMSMRAARMLEDQMTGRGPIPRRMALEAQARIVAIARDLEKAGELSLQIPGTGETEEMVE